MPQDLSYKSTSQVHASNNKSVINHIPELTHDESGRAGGTDGRATSGRLVEELRLRRSVRLDMQMQGSSIHPEKNVLVDQIEQ